MAPGSSKHSVAACVDALAHTKYATVAALGQAGGTIRGATPKDVGVRITDKSAALVENVELQIVEGAVQPSAEAHRAVADALAARGMTSKDWGRALGHAAGMTMGEASMRTDFADAADKSQGYIGLGGGNQRNPVPPLRGPEPRFVIRNPGTWSDGGAIDDWARLATPVTGVQIARALNERFGDNLYMRTELFVRAGATEPAAPGTAADFDIAEAAYAVCLSVADDEPLLRAACGTETFHVATSAGGTRDAVAVPKMPAGFHWTAQARKALVVRAHAHLCEAGLAAPVPDAAARVDALWERLTRPTVSEGTHKSMLQKTARLRATSLALPLDDGGQETADGQLFAMVACAALSTVPRKFRPEVKAMSSGWTLQLKRCGVTLVEDAYPTAADLGRLTPPGVGLTADRLIEMMQVAAHLHSEHPPYEPPPALFYASLCAMGVAVQSAAVLNWRALAIDADEALGTPADDADRAAERRAVQAALRRGERDGTLRAAREPFDADVAARIATYLCANGSFAGDKRMCVGVRDAARLLNGSVEVVRCSDAAVHAGLPAHILIDQHTDPGVGLAVARDCAGDSFLRRNRDLFRTTSGANPRLSGLPLRLADPQVATFLAAQRLASRFVFPLRPRQEALTAERRTLRVPVTPMVLAGAIGPVRAKVTNASGAAFAVVVTLGAKEVVMHEFKVRGSKHRPELDERAKTQAIESVRAGRHAFRSALLPGYTHASWADGGWTLSGPAGRLAWSWDTPHEQTVELRLTEPPPCLARILAGDVSVLADDALADEALRARADALACAPDLEAAVSRLAGMLSPALRRRLWALTRDGGGDTIELPVPRPDGTAARGDRPDPVDGDWDVWRCLLLLAHLAPAALRPVRLARFAVVHPAALAHVHGIIGRQLESGVVADDREARDCACRWFRHQLRHRPPMVHQRDIVRELVARQRDPLRRTRAQFVPLDTGLGKTLIALMVTLLESDHRVIYFTPKQVVDTLVKEVREWIRPVDGDRNMGETRLLRVLGKRTPDCDALINICPYQTLSTDKDGHLLSRLLTAAPSHYVVLDEAHWLFSACKRNSAVSQVFTSCAQALVMTATPKPPDRAYFTPLILGQCVNFPVSPANIEVAYADMVGAYVLQPVDAVLEEIVVELSPADRRRHDDAVASKRWRAAYDVCVQACLPRLCDEALARAPRPRLRPRAAAGHGRGRRRARRRRHGGAPGGVCGALPRGGRPARPRLPHRAVPRRGDRRGVRPGGPRRHRRREHDQEAVRGLQRAAARRGAAHAVPEQRRLAQAAPGARPPRRSAAPAGPRGCRHGGTHGDAARLRVPRRRRPGQQDARGDPGAVLHRPRHRRGARGRAAQARRARRGGGGGAAAQAPPSEPGGGEPARAGRAHGGAGGGRRAAARARARNGLCRGADRGGHPRDAAQDTRRRRAPSLRRQGAPARPRRQLPRGARARARAR